MTLQITPNRVHTKTHAKHHDRTQKKWNKRFGLKEVKVIDPEPITLPDNLVLPAAPVLGRAGRRLATMLREATALSPEQQQKEDERKLVALCDEMLGYAARANYDAVQFNVANEYERDFIESYVKSKDPKLALVFTVNGISA